MSEGRKALLIILVFFVVMGGFYFYRTADLNSELNKLEETIEQEQVTIQQLHAKEKTLQKQPQIKDIKQYADALPAERGNAQLLQYFHQVAKKNQIQILTIDFDDNKQIEADDKNTTNTNTNTTTNNNTQQPTQPEKQNGTKTIKINLTVKGDFNQLRYFVQDIYQSKRLINLANWQWAVTGNAPVVQMAFKTYYFPDLENELPPLAPIPTYEPSNRNNPT